MLMKKIVAKKKKLTPASIVSRPRKAAFLPRDADFLNSNPTIKLGRSVGAGFCGEVYSLKGNKNMVVKVPKHFTNSCYTEPNERARNLRWRTGDIEEEAKVYQDFDLNNRPLFIPTHITKMTSSFDKREYPVLVRPRIDPVLIDTRSGMQVNPKVDKKLTPSRLEQLRRDLIHISHMGIALADGMQLGMDQTGRILIYDAGRMARFPPGSGTPFDVNDNEWQEFLFTIGKIEGYSDLRKYGTVNIHEKY